MAADQLRVPRRRLRPGAGLSSLLCGMAVFSALSLAPTVVQAAPIPQSGILHPIVFREDPDVRFGVAGFDFSSPIVEFAFESFGVCPFPPGCLVPTLTGSFQIHADFANVSYTTDASGVPVSTTYGYGPAVLTMNLELLDPVVTSGFYLAQASGLVITVNEEGSSCSIFCPKTDPFVFSSIFAGFDDAFASVLGIEPLAPAYLALRLSDVGGDPSDGFRHAVVEDIFQFDLTVSAAPVPEPTGLLLAAVAAGGLSARRWWRRGRGSEPPRETAW